MRGAALGGLKAVSGTGIAAASLTTVRGVDGSAAEGGLVYQHTVIGNMGLPYSSRSKGPFVERLAKGACILSVHMDHSMSI